MNMSEKSDRFARPAELSDLGETVIADLVRVGLLSSESRSDVPKLRMVDESLRLFVPLLERYDVKLVPMQRPGCPVRFCTGILKLPAPAGSGKEAAVRSVPAGGQGDSAENAALGCIGELAERVSLWSLGDRDPRVFPTKNEQLQVDFPSFIGLSASQKAALSQRLGGNLPKDRDDGPDWSGVTDRWVDVVDLASGRRVEVPSFAVLFQESEATTGGALSFASSVGCAVWSSKEMARERAFLELAERDGVALAWYNRLGITFLPKGYLSEILPAELLTHLDAGTRCWGLYLVQTDLAVQVAMAVSYRPDGRYCAFGSAAAWDVASACKSAVEEMLQSENSLALMDRSYPEPCSLNGIPRQLRYARTRSVLEDLPLEGAAQVPDAALSQTFCYQHLLQSCLDRNISIWEFDATRPDLNIPCIKLLSPDLCTWEPRFGKSRLYESPVVWGLRQTQATEAEFAARPFPF